MTEELVERHNALLERVTVLERALENAAGEAYMALLDGDEATDPEDACREISRLCL
jgi:hypothetical protein